VALTGRVVWLVFAAAVVAAVILVLASRSCRPDHSSLSSTPADFDIDSVTVQSPDLAVELVSVRGAVHPGYIDWACLLTCSEPDGCHGEVELEVAFQSLGEDRTLRLAGRIDAADGEIMRIGRAQRPPVPVDGVNLVTLHLVSSYRPGAPTPTPME